MKTKCPLCKSPYKKGHCSNDDCKLSYVKPKDPIEWKHKFYIFTHPSPRGIFYSIRNRLFRRYDLIRTGVPKHQYSDKYHLMLLGMMGMLVDYIEVECQCEYFELNGWKDHKTDNGIPVVEFLLTLYTDWKVEYPKMVVKYDDALTLWADNCDIMHNIMGTEPEFPVDEELQKKRFDELQVLEQNVLNFEQDMLHRMVEIRQFLWT